MRVESPKLRWAMALLLLASPACARGNPGTARAQVQDVTARDYVGPPLRHAQLVFPDAFGSPHVVDVEVAEKDADRQRGLMWRETLATGKGMLFVFENSEEHSFWMRNTLISLDLVFLDENWKVVGALEGLSPQSLESRTVGRPSRYVVEVPAGWIAKTGVSVGAVVRASGW